MQRKLQSANKISNIRDKLKKMMKRVSKLQVKAPVTVGDIIAKNFTEKGINLVSTKSVEK